MIHPIAETMGADLPRNEPQTNRALAEGRDVEGGLVPRSVYESVRPALRHDLVLGPEAHALLAVLADIAEARALPPAEAVVADRHRDRHVDADHADIDSGGELARGVAVAGEDRDAVAVLMLRGQANRLLEVLGTDHLQDGPENLVLVGLHARLHVIEEGRADEEAFLVTLEHEAPAVDDQLGALVDAQLNILFDPLLVRLADDGAVVRIRVGRDSDAKAGDRGDQLFAQ